VCPPDRPTAALPVLHEYVGFLEAKRVDRGLRAGREQLVRAAVEDLCDMFTDPIKWARRWLTEFRDDPVGRALRRSLAATIRGRKRRSRTKPDGPTPRPAECWPPIQGCLVEGGHK
jgi:hypothetical protein